MKDTSNTEGVGKLIKSDRGITYREIETSLGIPASEINAILQVKRCFNRRERDLPRDAKKFEKGPSKLVKSIVASD